MRLTFIVFVNIFILILTWTALSDKCESYHYPFYNHIPIDGITKRVEFSEIVRPAGDAWKFLLAVLVNLPTLTLSVKHLSRENYCKASAILLCD